MLPRPTPRFFAFFASLFCGTIFFATAAGADLGPPITPVPPQASERIAAVQVRVAPDHRDWTYELGQPAKFRITVTADNTPVDNATVSYTTGPEDFPGPAKTAAVPPEGLMVDAGTLTEPGFLRCIATTEMNGHKSRGLATAAFSPEKIKPTQADPADFDAYWQKGREELSKIPLEARVTLLPDACTDKVNVYHVSFRTVSPAWVATPARIYGILCEPKAPGKYPAILRVPGAGVRPYFGDKGLAARGAITLEIGVHGIPVNQPQDVYDALASGALLGYWFFNLDDRDNYYYHRIYLSCLRANDFLTSREFWDGKNLVVMGASQGGQLAIVTAALDPRVTAFTATHPAYCDVTGDLHNRAGGWPRPFKRWAPGVPSAQETPVKIANTAYYDTVNFARRLKVPGYFSWGYNDETCPPTSLYAAFNLVTSPKTLGLTLELGHQYTPEQGDAINGWMAKFLSLK